jgi:MFS family permease
MLEDLKKKLLALASVPVSSFTPTSACQLVDQVTPMRGIQVDLSAGFPKVPQRLPSFGRIKALIVPIDFSDIQGTDNTVNYFSPVANGVSISVAGPSVTVGLAGVDCVSVKVFVGASVPNLARNEDELQKASQLFGSTWGIMMTVGASLGGVFAALLGRRAAYIADVITFIIAAILFSMVKTRMQQHDTSISQRVHPIADMREAVHVARNDRVIGSLMMSKTVWAIGAGLVSQLAVLSTDVFGTGDAGIGAMVAARGVGSAVAPIIAIRMTRGDLSNILFLCGAGTVVFGPLYIGAAWIPWFIPALILITLASIGSGSQWVASTYGLQIRTPDHIRGRVIAGDFALVTLILGATSALAGVVANHLGVQWTITAFAGVSLFCALTYSAIIYPIRKELKTQYPPI